jgi:hypothetical protein
MRRPYYVDEWYSLIEDANERSPDRPEPVAEMILQYVRARGAEAGGRVIVHLRQGKPTQRDR